MITTEGGRSDVAARLNDLLAEAGEPPLAADELTRFAAYLQVLMRWNAQTNLTAIRDEDGILRKHFVECIAAARALPDGIATLLDYGSGAGFPGIPIALCRAEIKVTLAESQGKKAAFLREAVRVSGVSVRVHGGRAELLSESFGCVALRAVDKMAEAVGGAAGLVEPAGWLAALTTVAEIVAVQNAAGAGFGWSNPVALPGGTDRILLLGHRS